MNNKGSEVGRDWNMYNNSRYVISIHDYTTQVREKISNVCVNWSDTYKCCLYE